MTPSQFRAAFLESHPKTHFFDPKAMRFFGDTMHNFGLRKVDIEGQSCLELYRKRPVHYGLRSSFIFDAKTLDRVYIRNRA